MLKKHVKKKHGERRVWPGKETPRKGDEKEDREIERERERCQEKEISRDTGLKDASKENSVKRKTCQRKDVPRERGVKRKR